MRKTCFRCGRTGHFPKVCKFKDGLCHACGKKGHTDLLAPGCTALNREYLFSISLYVNLIMYVYPLMENGLGLFNGIYWTVVIRFRFRLG